MEDNLMEPYIICPINWNKKMVPQWILYTIDEDFKMKTVQYFPILYFFHI
jgi:hypothetical protein